jgi:hypothetical protein
MPRFLTNTSLAVEQNMSMQYDNGHCITPIAALIIEPGPLDPSSHYTFRDVPGQLTCTCANDQVKIVMDRQCRGKILDNTSKGDERHNA